MRLRILLLLTLAAVGVFAFMQSRPISASDQQADGQRAPVIVELFTAEGCSSCPPADALLRKLEAEQPVPNAEIIVLGEHVDYWNELGWKDRFSAAQFTDRQRSYVSDFALDSAYTPQMVVDGRAEMNGSDAKAASKAIAEAARKEKTEVSLQIKNNPDGLPFALYGVDEASGKRNAELVLAITETNLETQVKKGENEGRTLRHTGVVRYWKSFPVERMSVGGTAPLKLDPTWNRANLRVVAFLQDKKTLQILGATSEKLP